MGAVLTCRVADARRLNREGGREGGWREAARQYASQPARVRGSQQPRVLRADAPPDDADERGAWPGWPRPRHAKDVRGDQAEEVEDQKQKER